MATIYYTLSSKRNALGQSEIMMRFSHGKINQRAKTGLFVSPAYWADGAIRIPNFRMRPSAEVQAEVNDSVETQKRLAEITSLVSRAFNEIGRGSVPPNWLRSLVEAKDDSKEGKTLWQYFDDFLGSRLLSVRRIRSYHVVVRALKRFEQYKRLKSPSFALTLENLACVDMIDDFEEYFRNEARLAGAAGLYQRVSESRKPQDRGLNTVNSKMVMLRAFLNWA